MLNNEHDWELSADVAEIACVMCLWVPYRQSGMSLPDVKYTASFDRHATLNFRTSLTMSTHPIVELTSPSSWALVTITNTLYLNITTEVGELGWGQVLTIRERDVGKAHQVRKRKCLDLLTFGLLQCRLSGRMSTSGEDCPCSNPFGPSTEMEDGHSRCRGFET